MSNRNPFARRMRDDARRDDPEAAPAAPGLLNGRAGEATEAATASEPGRLSQARADALRAATKPVRDRIEPDVTKDQP